MRSALSSSRAAYTALETQVLHAPCRRHLASILTARHPTRRRTAAAPAPAPAPASSGPHLTHRRHLFTWPDWMSGGGADISSGSDEPGTKQMQELVTAVQNNVRPPPPFILAKAFRAFVEGRLAAPGRHLTWEQARFLCCSFEHLAEKYWGGKGAVEKALRVESLEEVLGFLHGARWDGDADGFVARFAGGVYGALCRRRVQDEPELGREVVPDLGDARTYVAVAAAAGATRDALKLLERDWCELLDPEERILPWLDVLVGFVREGNEERISHTLDLMEKKRLELDSSNLERLVLTLAKEGHMWTKEIYEQTVAKGIKPTAPTTEAVIQLAIRNKMVPWAKKLLSYLPDDEGSIGVRLQVSAAMGDDPMKINRQLQAISAYKPNTGVDIESFNLWMDYSLSCARYDDVEKYAKLIDTWKLVPNATTYAIWMNSRLQTGDVAGALRLLEKMRTEAGDEAVDDVLLNKLIQGLCNARDQSFDFDVTLDVVDELFESRGRFMPATVAALCATMLRRHDVEGVSDLLEQLLSTFGAHDKAKIREPLVAFINDATQPAGEAWDVYELVNNHFPDTPVAQRTQIMQTFFRRGYAHQATLVFGHMRAKNLGEQRPTATTYTECLLGIAGARDEGALGMVHNMLKMDLEIKLDTRLLNALMFAYTCCGEPGTALEQFKQILHSEEGPSEATILVFFRTCEIYDEGAAEARRMMLNLRSLEIPVGRRMYEAFMAALMGNGDMHGAIDAVRSMEAQVGERPDAVTLATLYNVAPFQMVKKQIEEWCQSAYPDLWSQVDKLGYETDMFGTKTFKIDRGIEI